MITPYNGRFKVSQIYKGQPHKGMDLVGLDSKDIHSTVAGTVESARWDHASDHKYGMGQYVRIKDDVTGHRYYFAHLSQLCVKSGQRVTIGQKIGVEGSTGHSTGSHLHYEVRRIPDNTTYLDVSQISGIPNKLGAYTADNNKEEEDMTEEQVRKIIREELSGTGKPVSDWAKPFWEARTADGVVDGTNPQGVVTREQAATMLSKIIDREAK